LRQLFIKLVSTLTTVAFFNMPGDSDMVVDFASHPGDIQDVWATVLMVYLAPLDRAMAICASSQKQIQHFHSLTTRWGRTKDDYWQLKVASVLLHPRKSVTDYILDLNVDQSCPEKVFVTPLHLAARNGDADLCKRLIREKADINANVKLRHLEHQDVSMKEESKWLLDFGKITPLRMAMTFNHPEVCAVLKEAGGNGGSGSKGKFTDNEIKLRSVLVTGGRIEKHQWSCLYRREDASADMGEHK